MDENTWERIREFEKFKRDYKEELEVKYLRELSDRFDDYCYDQFIEWESKNQ